MKIIKKMALAVIILSTFTSSVFAVGLNNDKRDLPTLRVSKADGTKNKWGPELSKIVPGDKISFAIYYHATGGMLNNVVVNLDNLENFYSAGQTVKVNATVKSDEISKILGNSKISFDKNVKLEWFDTSWQANQCDSTKCASKLPNRQRLEEILSPKGINIGNIAEGWENQGTVVVTYKVLEGKKEVVSEVKKNNQSASILTNSSNSTVTLWIVGVLALLAIGILIRRFFKHKSSEY